MHSSLEQIQEPSHLGTASVLEKLKMDDLDKNLF